MNGELENTPESVDSLQDRYLVFQLGDDIFGFEIEYVTEIVAIQPITPLPETEPYVKGIMNLRGEIITVIDMRLRLRKTPVEYNDRTCVIITRANGKTVGLIVDSVSEVLNIKKEDIAPSPENDTGVQSKYIMGISKSSDRVILLIDCQKIVTNDLTPDNVKLLS